jgi:hypothetical protein
LADQISSWCEALRWHRETYMTPPPDASARDLFHVGVNRLVSYLRGYVLVARGENRFAPQGDDWGGVFNHSL